MAQSQLKPRFWGSILLLTLLTIMFYGQWQLDAGLADMAVYSGWTLVILSFLLSIYNLRKKVSSFPMGRAWYWRKAHSFLGWLAVAIFIIHAGLLPPDGLLNFLLWLLYAFVLISGVLGLWISLTLPPRIALGGERLQFERIPHLRQAQYRRAEQVILAASTDGIGQPLLEFHNDHLRRYLGCFREGFRHCINSSKYADRLLRDLKNIGRYIDSSSQQYVAELQEIIEKKHVLDRQYALQYVLKKWAYFHIGLNYMSWAFVLIHVLVMYAYRLEYGL